MGGRGEDGGAGSLYPDVPCSGEGLQLPAQACASLPQ